MIECGYGTLTFRSPLVSELIHVQMRSEPQASAHTS